MPWRERGGGSLLAPPEREQTAKAALGDNYHAQEN